jgi:hypothetical protein
MAHLFTNVQPGTLITSQAWNQVMQTLNSYGDRISALESTGAVANGVVISSVNPSGPVQVGATLQIIGSNFGFSIGATQVTFSGVSVSSFLAGSSDTQLVVVVPNTNPAPGGTLTTVTVANQNSSATTPILVLPVPQPVIGPVVITPGQPIPSPVVQAATAIFPFVLTSGANLPASYAVTPTVTGPAWQSLLQLLDGNKTLITTGQVALSPGLPTTIYISIAIPTGSNTIPFALGLSVASGTRSSGSSGLSSYTVGVVSTPPDTTIGFTFGSANPTTAVSGQTVTVPSGSAALLTFVSTYTVPGTYTITAALVGATNWNLLINQPAPTPPGAVFTFTLGAMPAGGYPPLNITFALAPQAGATSGQVQFTIQNKGVTGSQTQLYQLAL